MKANKIIGIAGAVSGALVLCAIIVVVAKKICRNKYACRCLPCCTDDDEETPGEMDGNIIFCIGGQKKDNPKGE